MLATLKVIELLLHFITDLWSFPTILLPKWILANLLGKGQGTIESN